MTKEQIALQLLAQTIGALAVQNAMAQAELQIAQQPKPGSPLQDDLEGRN